MMFRWFGEVAARFFINNKGHRRRCSIESFCTLFDQCRNIIYYIDSNDEVSNALKDLKFLKTMVNDAKILVLASVDRVDLSDELCMCIHYSEEMSRPVQKKIYNELLDFNADCIIVRSSVYAGFVKNVVKRSRAGIRVSLGMGVRSSCFNVLFPDMRTVLSDYFEPLVPLHT